MRFQRSANTFPKFRKKVSNMWLLKSLVLYIVSNKYCNLLLYRNTIKSNKRQYYISLETYVLRNIILILICINILCSLKSLLYSLIDDILVFSFNLCDPLKCHTEEITLPHWYIKKTTKNYRWLLIAYTHIILCMQPK